MALTTKTKVNRFSSWRDYLLPAYLIISALIILLVIYNFITNSIYAVWLQNGANQGYQAAVGQLIEQVKDKCDPVEVTLDNVATVQVINAACIQQASSQQAAPTQIDTLQQEATQ